MNNHCGTSNCIKCHKPATLFSGHIIGKERMALGNLVEIKILAGWCCIEHHDSMKSDANGCYGKYDNEKMGEIIKVW
jgi:hypothetical protein